jgi:protein-S-isoprenylcysteine O-methyltransferase Ste14
MMELLPDLEFGWLNGWLLLAMLGLTDGILFLIFRRNTVKRLFDRSGWTTGQIVITLVGKLLALVAVLMIIFTPLKLGSPVFFIGVVLVVIGLIALVRALVEFRKTPHDQPVTTGIYRVTRHPQILASSLVILGCVLAIGSWLALILFVAARIFLHANLIAEEDVCLREYGEAYREYMNQVPRYGFL